MAAHRYWRIYIAESLTSPASFVEIELRTVIGGADVTAPGMATSASSTLAGTATANAIDNLVADVVWAAAQGARGEWWRVDLGAGNEKDVVQMTMRARSTVPSQTPTAFRLQFSDDDATWTTKDAFSAATWTAGMVQTFNTRAIALWACSTAALLDDAGAHDATSIVGLVGGDVVTEGARKGLVFSGDDYAAIPPSVALRNALLGTSTVVFSLKHPDPTSVYAGTVLYVGDSLGRRIAEVIVGYNDLLVAWNRDPNPAVVWEVSSSDLAAIGVGWSQIAIRRTVTGGLVKHEFFVNGIAAGWGQASAPGAWWSADVARVGWGSLGQNLRGVLDDLRIYAVGLTDAEIAASAAGAAGTDYPALFTINASTPTDEVIDGGSTRNGGAFDMANFAPELLLPATLTLVQIADSSVRLDFDKAVTVPAGVPVVQGGTIVTGGTPEQAGAIAVRVPLVITAPETPPGGGGGGFAVIFPR